MRKQLRMKLMLTLLLGLISISTVGCSVLQPRRAIRVLPPRPQIVPSNCGSGSSAILCLDLENAKKLDAYIAALERAK